jgi:hypothetical protein
MGQSSGYRYPVATGAPGGWFLEAPMPITRISVTITEDTPAGPRHLLYGLSDMRKFARAERVDDLLDDLEVICEDVQEARDRAGESGRRPPDSASHSHLRSVPR